MKIHEKLLTHYLSCTSPVDKEGYLYKKKERTATYHRRWFVLKGNLLFYQERPADRHLLGVVVLEGCFAFNLAFGPGLRTYRLAAADRRTQEGWVKALLSASHRYLSLLLRDLARQYQEARQQHGCAESRSSAGAPEQLRSSFLFGSQGQTPEVREGRSLSAGTASHPPPAPAKAKRSPKLWPRRNAYVTPINGPAAPYGEWPLVGLDSLEDFSKLHDYYGQEVRKAREDWLRGGAAGGRRGGGDLIDLG
uniref:Sesquipedalian n=1 Tax=Salarias fasciatus TaxID=181472 RepID=A0A672H127_SALFA